MSYDRRRVLAALEAQGITILREGGRHTIVGRAGGVRTSLPRHTEIDRRTARAIAKQLGLDLRKLEEDAR